MASTTFKVKHANDGKAFRLSQALNPPRQVFVFEVDQKLDMQRATFEWPFAFLLFVDLVYQSSREN